ncbi:MAG: corrinoid protein [Calditrichota bacterium]
MTEAEHQLIFAALQRAVVEMNPEAARQAARQAVTSGAPPLAAITEGLAAGMRLVGDKFSCGEYYVPEVLAAARALNIGMEILKPHLPTQTLDSRKRAILAVVKGDIHDIGKNIVKLFWESAGYEVLDLGKNVPLEKCLEAVQEYHPAAVGLSTLMTTTLPVMEKTVKELRNHSFQGLKILVGGASVTPDWASSIGADFYGQDGASALEGLRRLIGPPLDAS